MVRSKTWREQIIEHFKEYPLKCTHCGNHYEFKGTVELKNGHLKVVYANDVQAHSYLKREIKRLEEETNKIEKVQIYEETFKELRFNWESLQKSMSIETVNFICLQCGKEELIPMEVVEHFDFLDAVDPPKLNCEECYGEMVSEYFESHRGVVYDNKT